MKYAFFTGATGGIGNICIKEIVKTGNWIVFAAGTNEIVLEQLTKIQNVIPVKMDVTDQESVEAAYTFVKCHTDKLDVVLNFAGIAYFNSLIEGDSINAVKRSLEVNILGMVRVNRVFFDMLLRGKGRIVNCSSESGWMTPQPFAGPYVLSKYAVEAYNDSLRRELLYMGIPVIKIQPGAYETKLTKKVNEYFDSVLSETKYYSKLLIKMKPMMSMEMSQKNNPANLASTVRRAMESKHPKNRYRVGTGRLLLFLELFPDACLDAIYKVFYGRP